MDDFRLGIIGLFAPGFAARIQEDRQRRDRDEYDRLMKAGAAVPWDEDRTKIAERLLLDATTWKDTKLFDCKPLTGLPGSRMKKTDQMVFSPDGRWCYANHVCPAGEWLNLFQGRKRGQVAFTAKVNHPVLCEVINSERPKVWMSYTPTEALSQRAGVLKATGRVVVGGLGLGWFLNKVCSKPSVTEVILVEREQVLLDWLKPVLLKTYPALSKVTWVRDDVYAYIERDEKNHANTKYLLDIWDGFGGCDHKFYTWKKKLGSKRIWGWGDVEY